MSNRRDAKKKAPRTEEEGEVPGKGGEETPEDRGPREEEGTGEAEIGTHPVEGDGAEEAELGRVRAELEEARDLRLRLAAEFDNFRRRSHTQLAESATRAQAALAGKLVEVLDDFDRVSSLEPEQATAEAILEGVGLVERKLNKVLEEAGLEPLEPEGNPFDPNEMEAIMREPATSEDEDDVVGRVLQKGYRFRGHLVRPARVSVLKYEHAPDA